MNEIKTIIHLIKFKYISFDQCEVTIIFQNNIDISLLKKGIYNKNEISADIREHYSCNFPIDRADQKLIALKDKTKIAIIFKDNKTNNAIAPIFNFKNHVLAGKKIKNLMPPDLQYDGIRLFTNRHLLWLKEGLNIEIKKIDCPLPLSIYDLLKRIVKC